MMKHILVPVDGSEASLRAVEAAKMQAKAFDAQITLTHVVASPYRDTFTMGYRTLPMQHSAEAHPDQLALLDRLVKEMDPVGEMLIMEGPVSTAIVGLVEQGEYDMIVMGSEGLGNAMRRFLMGSVTKYVLEHVKIPVLVVR